MKPFYYSALGALVLSITGLLLTRPEPKTVVTAPIAPNVEQVKFSRAINGKRLPCMDEWEDQIHLPAQTSLQKKAPRIRFDGVILGYVFDVYPWGYEFRVAFRASKEESGFIEAHLPAEAEKLLLKLNSHTPIRVTGALNEEGIIENAKLEILDRKQVCV